MLPATAAGAFTSAQGAVAQPDPRDQRPWRRGAGGAHIGTI